MKSAWVGGHVVMIVYTSLDNREGWCREMGIMDEQRIWRSEKKGLAMAERVILLRFHVFVVVTLFLMIEWVGCFLTRSTAGGGCL